MVVWIPNFILFEKKKKLNLKPQQHDIKTMSKYCFSYILFYTMNNCTSKFIVHAHIKSAIGVCVVSRIFKIKFNHTTGSSLLTNNIRSFILLYFHLFAKMFVFYCYSWIFFSVRSYHDRQLSFDCKSKAFQF